LNQSLISDLNYIEFINLFFKNLNMNTYENKNIDDMDKISDNDKKSKVSNFIKFLGMLVLLALLAKLLAWLLG